MGPTIILYVGTNAVFQVSMVSPHTEHWKLLTSPLGAIASVRRSIAPHLQVRCGSDMGHRVIFSALSGYTRGRWNQSCPTLFSPMRPAHQNSCGGPDALRNLAGFGCVGVGPRP
jgi:hypothetical protein